MTFNFVCGLMIVIIMVNELPMIKSLMQWQRVDVFVAMGGEAKFTELLKCIYVAGLFMLFRAKRNLH